MITTLLMTCLAATEVNSVDAAAQPAAVEQSGWSVQLAIATPSVIGVAIGLDPTGGTLTGLGGLPVIVRSSFANALTVERAVGSHWSGTASLSFGSSITPVFNAFTGSGVVGARWYPARTFQGFFIGPELSASIQQFDLKISGLTITPLYGAGAGARAGWVQRFGANFVASASAGLNGSVVWRPRTNTMEASQTLNLGLDVMLSAGLVF